MAETNTIVEQAYSAFNKRDIDGALALLTQHVTWPKASEGGKIVANIKTCMSSVLKEAQDGFENTLNENDPR